MVAVVASAVVALSSQGGFLSARPGDVITISGSPVTCLVQQAGYLCFLRQRGAPRVGSYAVVLAAPGVAGISRVTSTLAFAPVVTTTTGQVDLAAARAMAGVQRTLRLRIGAVTRLRVAGVEPALDCVVTRSAQTPTLYCSLDDEIGPVPGTYAIVVNARRAALGLVLASRRTLVTDLRLQPG
ncbi:MAG: hypothetical protein WCH31_04930 [Actinomycetes bacterium]